MAVEKDFAHVNPSWFTPPGESDMLAWVSLAILGLAIYGIASLYAAFDRWAEHKSQGTPLAKTIPTLLVIALLYEIFPLEHFHVFLPISAVLIALMADWSRFHLPSQRGLVQDAESDTEVSPKQLETSIVANPADLTESKHD